MTLTLEQAAARLLIHPETLRERAARGEIPAAKPGRRWVFLEGDLTAYIRQRNKTETIDDLIKRRTIYVRKGPAIYFLLLGQEVVYVGKTKNLIRRLGDHSFRKEFDGFAYFPCSEEKLDELELQSIQALKPRYNRNGKS